MELTRLSRWSIFAFLMTSFPSSAGGALGHRQVRSLYPRITENHLRYLEKWGLLRQSHVPRGAREYSFPDIQTIKQLATELERGTPLKTILRSLAAEHQGQMQLDFQEGRGRVGRAAGEGRRARAAPRAAPASPAPPRTPSVQFPFNDPQSALAAKYFVEGSRLDDGEERNVDGGRVSLPQGADHRSRPRAGASSTSRTSTTPVTS